MNQTIDAHAGWRAALRAAGRDGTAYTATPSYERDPIAVIAWASWRPCSCCSCRAARAMVPSAGEVRRCEAIAVGIDLATNDAIDASSFVLVDTHSGRIVRVENVR